MVDKNAVKTEGQAQTETSKDVKVSEKVHPMFQDVGRNKLIIEPSKEQSQELPPEQLKKAEDKKVEVKKEDLPLKKEEPKIEDLPEKYKGKSSLDIVKMHQEAEKTMSKYRSERDKLISDTKKQAEKNNSEVKQMTDDEFFEKFMAGKPLQVLEPIIEQKINKIIEEKELQRQTEDTETTKIKDIVSNARLDNVKFPYFKQVEPQIALEIKAMKERSKVLQNEDPEFLLELAYDRAMSKANIDALKKASVQKEQETLDKVKKTYTEVPGATDNRGTLNTLSVEDRIKESIVNVGKKVPKMFQY